MAELVEPLRLGPDLLVELSGRAVLGRLAGHVELAGRDLEQRLVDRAPVLAHQQHMPPSASSGTTQTAPGWRTTTRSKGKPSGPTKVPTTKLRRSTRIADPFTDLAEGSPGVGGRARHSSGRLGPFRM